MILVSVALRRAVCAIALLVGSGTARAATGPDAPDAAYLAGSYAASIGDNAAAARLLGKAVQDTTTHGAPADPALVRRAFIAAVLAQNPAATTLARRLGTDPLALMVRGNAAMQAKQYTKAASVFAALPKQGVAALIRPLLLAWADTGAGDNDRAIERLQGLVGLVPFGPVYALNAAMIADLAGREAQAAPFYAQAAHTFAAPNLRLAQAVASFEARQGHTNAANAILVRMAGSHPELVLALAALEQDEANPPVVSARDGVAEAYLTLAGSIDQPQQILLRRILLGFALALRPDLSAARLVLADVDVALKQTDQAEAVLSAIKPADPLYGTALMQRGQIEEGSNKAAGLLPALEALAKAHPDDVGALTLAADIERDGKHDHAARTLYSRALARLGANPPANAWALYYGRAITEDTLHDWSAAKADLHHALALQPGQPFVLNYLGYSEALRGVHLAQAQAMIEQALQVDPNEGAIIDSLGYVLLRRGKIAEALQVQTRAVQAAPTDAEVNAHLAAIFAAAGDRLAARNQWARALALHPDAREKARIEAHLKHDAAGS